jgi:predicted site-specific integrase-resolvase
MWRAGTLPAECEQLATGTVLVRVQSHEPHMVALYARVSSADQKADLDRQLARLVEFAAREKLVVADSAAEIGSGLNGHRKALMRLLRNASVGTIVVEHRDRLARFGFEYIESALASANRKIVVIDANEVKDDIVRDLHEIIVSLCSRLYGKRSAERRAKKAVEALA